MNRTGSTVAITGVLAALLVIPAWAAEPSPVAGSFSLTGPLAEARAGHTTTLLPDGRVLVIGGFGIGLGPGGAGYRPEATPRPRDIRASAELWDPASGTFGPTGGLAVPRAGHTATLLPDGRVLVIGGRTAGSWLPLATAEVWDPATGTFTSAGTLTTGHSGHTVTLLPDGRVLIVGGSDGRSDDPTILATAELWDPATAAFGLAGQLDAARWGHTATLLADGSVLIVGGTGSLAQPRTAELWSPISGGFGAAGELTGDHGIGHTATLLHDGRVAVMGGYDAADTDTGLAGPLQVEMWDPATNAFAVQGSLSDWRYTHQAVLLGDGRVLLVGGVTPASRTEVWDPATGVATPADPRTPEVLSDTVTLLPDGRVLLIGGWNLTTREAAEIWDPGTGMLGAAGALHQARYHHSATLLADGSVLVTGGLWRPPATTTPQEEPDRVIASAELWEPGP